MLAKKYRLPIQFFPRVRLRTVRTAHVSIKIAPNALPHPRFGVLVSTNVAKNATKRNALRRWVFNFLRTGGFEKKRGFSYDVLIILSPSAAVLSKESFLDALREIFRQIESRF